MSSLKFFNLQANFLSISNVILSVFLHAGVWLMLGSQALTLNLWLALQKTSFSSSLRPSGSRALIVD